MAERDGEDAEIAQKEFIVVDDADIVQGDLADLWLHLFPGGRIGIDGKVVFAAQDAGALDMVQVFVRDENAAKRCGGKPDLADRLLDQAARRAGIDQQRRAFRRKQ